MIENIFNSNKNTEELKKEIEAREIISNALLEIMLCANIPEEEKIPMRIIKAHRVIINMLMDIEQRVADPELENSQELFETRKKVLEYFNVVGAGIQKFMELTPLPNQPERR